MLNVSLMFSNDLELNSKKMLKLDTYGYCQKNFDVLELVCTQGMKHYSQLLSVVDNKIDEFFYQEHFNEMRWYDI